MWRSVLGASLATAVLLVLTPLARGATLSVANNGVDAPGCGAKASPCRSISQAIANAAAGDAIVVGPGRYGAGIDTPAPGCGCVLAVNKAVAVASRDGAAATVIAGNEAPALQNVLIVAVGAAFGKPGKGFTITNTASPSGGHGIVIDGAGVTVVGNQLVRIGEGYVPAFGIWALSTSTGIRIEGNQVIGWPTGIGAFGTDTTVRKNVSVLNGLGIQLLSTAAAVGNVAAANAVGIELYDGSTAIGNATLGNTFAGVSAQTGLGVIEKNNFLGNACGVRHQTSNVAAVLDASPNYWGAASGPGSAPADPACSLFGAPITVAPFATKPFGAKVRIKP